MKRSTSGFTIVELLIVIVVIAILAAIGIVAYNAIQTRAENTKTIQGVNQYVKLLQNYKTLNGDYPTYTGSSYACLGNGYANDTCIVAADSSPQAVSITSFDTALKTVGTLPNLSTVNMTMSTGQLVAGASYQTSSKLIRYHLKGNDAQCSAGGSRYVYGDVIQCRITLD